MNHSHRSPKTQNALAAKVVVITGASSGAGRAAAIAFAREQCRLVLAARRIDVLDELAVECEKLGASAITVQTDVTDMRAMDNLALQAVTFGGRIDVWINNAGVLAAGEFNETPVEVHDQVIRINLMGYIHGAYAAMPIFKQQSAGILINNISIGGFYPTPYAVGYSASKFGIRGFSDALKGELSSWPDIHVCDLYPAFLDTPGIQHAANYTGKVLKPAPPVYDPRKLARAMVRVAINPKKSTTVGAAAYVLRLGYFMMPEVMRLVTAKVMETYFANADPSPKSSGNLFVPLELGTGIDGDEASRPGKKPKNLALAAGLLLTTVMVIRAIRGRNPGLD